MAAEDAEMRSRLSEAMEERRRELRLSWDRVAKLAGMSIAHLRRVRGAEVPVTPKTRRKLERALGWADGAVDAVLAGKDPEVLVNDDETVPTETELATLEPWEAHIWRTPDLTPRERRAAIDVIHSLRT